MDINQKSKLFLSHSLCPYCLLWGKCKELQRKGQVNQVIGHGAVVTIRITENCPAIKIFHEKDLMLCQKRPQDMFKRLFLYGSYFQLQVR